MLKVLCHKSQWKPTFIFKFLLFFTWQNYYYLFQTFLEIQPKPAETWKVLEQLMFQCAKSLITAIFHLKGWRTSLFIFLPFCTLVSKRVCSCILDYVCVARRIFFFFLVNSSDIARRDTRTRALEEERHTGRRARHWTRWFSSVKSSLTSIFRDASALARVYSPLFAVFRQRHWF